MESFNKPRFLTLLVSALQRRVVVSGSDIERVAISCTE